MKSRFLLGALILILMAISYFIGLKSTSDSVDKTVQSTEILTSSSLESADQTFSTTDEINAAAGQQLITSTRQDDATFIEYNGKNITDAKKESICNLTEQGKCVVKTELDLENEVVVNSNISMEVATILLGSENYKEAIQAIGSSKVDNSHFETELQIQSYISKNMQSDIHSMDIGCGKGVCMAAFNLDKNSDFSESAKRLQSADSPIGSSITSERDMGDYKQIRLIFLAGSNASEGFTIDPKNYSTAK